MDSKLLWCGRDRRRQGQTSLLTHNFFSIPYHAVLFSRSHLTLLLLLGQGYSAGGPLWAIASSGELSVTVSWHWLTLSPNDPNWQAGIGMNYFITPTISNRSRDCFRLFTQVHLWLTARSRVNIQHKNKY